ncbi:MAG: DUF1887 family CARF protein, partial [Bacteroidota bacterium]
MPHHLVCLISDQSAPNLLVLLSPVFQSVDRYVFVTTPEMEAKGRLGHLLDAVPLPTTKVQTIVVAADHPGAVLAALTAACPLTDHRYSVHISGGTKMMSLGVWTYFTHVRARTDIYYLPIGSQQLWHIYPMEAGHDLELTRAPSVDEYLRAYGLTPAPAVVRLGTEQLEAQLLRHYLAATHPLASVPKPVWWFGAEAAYQLRESQQDTLPLSALPWLSEWLTWLGYTPQITSQLSAAEVAYLNTGWFPQYCTRVLQRTLRLPATAIRCHLHIHRTGGPTQYANNELDIVFLYQHKLYVLECKTAIRQNYNDTSKLFNQALQRLANLRQEFGLHVQAGFLTLSDRLRKKTDGPLLP